MHWLALHLPDLPLEIHSRALETPGPLAVIAPGHGRRILLCNPAAAAAGIAPGQSAAAALALAAELRLLPRRPARERAALEGIARWAFGFSSEVSLAPPAALLLETGRSLRLFGGVQGLLQRLLPELAGLGWRACWCLAPTPAGALLLARQGGDAVLEERTALRAALGRVPLSGLGLPARSLEILQNMGLSRLGELLRLPRAGLAQRLGLAFVRDLERLLGEVPDPRPPYVPPPRFEAQLELPAEVEDVHALLFAARRLILELCGFLRGREGGAQRLEWELAHAGGQSSRLVLGLARPGRDPERLLGLLQERLERFEPAAPVRALRLRVEEVQPLHPQALELFADPQRQREEAGGRLLERLQARLGRAAVVGLKVLPEHRPERAWGRCLPGHGVQCPGRGGRPPWLLPEPLPLEERDGRPRHRGEPLDLGAERERIESGWWDGDPLARDYFIARTPGGERLWVFRELGGRRGWFLHGVFS